MNLGDGLPKDLGLWFFGKLCELGQCFRLRVERGRVFLGFAAAGHCEEWEEKKRGNGKKLRYISENGLT